MSGCYTANQYNLASLKISFSKQDVDVYGCRSIKDSRLQKYIEVYSLLFTFVYAISIDKSRQCIVWLVRLSLYEVEC